MNPAQQAAFQAASGVTAPTLLLGIVSSILVLAFIWVVWVTLGSFRAWQNGNASLFDRIRTFCQRFRTPIEIEAVSA